MTLWNLQTFEPLVRLQGCRLLGGAHLLADGRIISWDQYGENEIWLWDPQDAEMMPFEIEPGVPVIKMRGHTATIRGVSILSDGRLLSWSSDGTLRLWDGKTGDPLVEMSGLDGEVKGVRVLTNGHILAWSGTTVQIWDGLTDLPLAVFKPQSRIQEVQVLAKKRFLVMCRHELLVIEDFSRGPLRVLDMHKIDGAKQLSDGRIAAWTNDGALTLWELDAGITRRYPNPWIESCDCLPSIKLEGKLAGAQARGSIWTQAQGTYMSIVDARSGCVARWHGDIVDVQDYLPPIVIGRNHTQLRFLEILSHHNLMSPHALRQLNG